MGARALALTRTCQTAPQRGPVISLCCLRRRVSRRVLGPVSFWRHPSSPSS